MPELGVGALCECSRNEGMPPPTLRMVVVERLSRGQLLMGERIAQLLLERKFLPTLGIMRAEHLSLGQLELSLGTLSVSWVALNGDRDIVAVLPGRSGVTPSIVIKDPQTLLSWAANMLCRLRENRPAEGEKMKSGRRTTRCIFGFVSFLLILPTYHGAESFI